MELVNVITGVVLVVLGVLSLSGKVRVPIAKPVQMRRMPKVLVKKVRTGQGIALVLLGLFALANQLIFEPGNFAKLLYSFTGLVYAVWWGYQIRKYIY